MKSIPTILQAAVLLPFLCTMAARAATFVWDGSYSGNWGAGLNWNTGTVPQDGDDLVFPAGPTRLATTNNTSTTRRFRSITISGANYALRGNSLTLSNGITATYAAGSSASIALDITLAKAQELECATDNSILYLTGDLALGAFTLTASGAGNLLLGGVISGAGGLTKNGSGSLRLYGSSANTYSGVTRVNAGTLEFNKSSGLNALAGDLVAGDNSGADTVRWLNSSQLPATTDVTVNQGALLDLNNFSEALGALTLNAGDVETGSGTLTLGGDLTAGGVDGLATINGKLSLGSATRTFHILRNPDSSYPEIYVYAAISGSGGLTKTGSGYLSLAGTNTYGGLTFVSDGVLLVDDGAALGGTAAGTSVGPGGELHLRGNTRVGDESLTLTGLGPPSLSHFTLGCYGGTSNSWAGPVTLVNDVGINVGPDARLDLAGQLSGAGGFTTVGTGTLVLSGSQANTFAGDVRVNSGSLHLNKTITDGALPGPGALTIGADTGGSGTDMVRSLRNAQIDGTVAITINTSGVLHLNGFNETIGPLTLNAGQVQTLAGTLTLGGDVTARSTNVINSFIAGHLALGSSTRTFHVLPGGRVPELGILASVSGSGGIRKTGRGLLGLAASNTFTGLLTVAEGSLLAEDGHAFGATNQGTVVEAGARVSVGPDVHVGDEPLTLYGEGATGSSYCLATSGVGSNSWAGPITLEEDATVWVFSDCYLNLAGPISGPGGFTMTGYGTLLYSGSSGNTYAGDTRVRYGTLELGKAGGTAAAIRYGTLFIGDGVGGADADVVRLVAHNQLWSTVPIVITNSGWLDLNGHNDIVGPLTFSAGRASSGPGGMLRLAGDVTASYVSSGRPAIEGNVFLSADRTFAVANSSGSPDLDLSAAVSGSGGFTKTGPGALSLSASNEFSGTVTVNDGLVYLYHDAALGSAAAGTVVNDGGVLVLANGRTIAAEPLTLNGNGDGIAGALASIGGSNAWAGPVTLPTDAVITVQTNGFLNLPGQLTGPAGFVKAQPGTLLLSGPDPNTYAGTTWVNAGTLALAKSATNQTTPGPLVIGDGLGGANADVVRLDAPNQTGYRSPVTIHSSGLLDLEPMGSYPNATHMGSLTGSGQVNLGDAGLSTGWDDSSTTFSGVIDGPLSAAGLWKYGHGTFTLTGTNTYLGHTWIYQGTLLVNGFQPGSPLIVNLGGTLGGSGTVGRLGGYDGVIAPGASVGTLTCSNALFRDDSLLRFELAGAACDQLNVRGGIALSNATLQISAPGLLPAEGQQFVLLRNDGTDPVTNTFAGLPEGALVSAGPRQFRITYAGGTGNDVVLIATNTAALRPALSIRRTATNSVLLSWPQSDIPWLLQAATNLAATPVSWAKLPPPYPTNATDCLVVEPAPAGSKFYRLHGP